MSAAKPCQEYLTAAVACINVANSGECGCMDTATFAETFEMDVRASYLSTQAFVSPSDQMFCQVANDRVCDFSSLNYSCCCQPEVSAYEKCLVETILPQELPPPVAYETSTCQHVCAPPDNAGLSLPMLIGCSVGIAVVVCLLGVLLCRCRRRRAMRRKNLDLEEGKKVEALEETHDSEPAELFQERAIEEPIDLEKGGHASTSSDDDSWDAKAKGDEAVYKARIVPSKAFADEEEELESGNDSKADLLKKKRAIENWNKDRKEGSNRCLQSYLHDEDMITNPSLKDKEKKSKRLSSRQLVDTKEATELVKANENDISNDRPRRSSSRTDGILLDDDEMKVKPDKPARSSSRQLLKGEDEDTSKKQKSKEGKKKDKDSSTDKQSRSSSRNLRDADEGDQNKGQDSKPAVPRRSSSTRLDAQDGEREKQDSKKDRKKSQDSSTDKIRRSSRNRLDADDDAKETSQDYSKEKVRQPSSRNRLDANEDAKQKSKDSSTDKVRQSSSRNRIDADDDAKKKSQDSRKDKPRRSSSQNRLDADEDEDGKKDKKDKKKSKKSSTDKPRRSSSRSLRALEDDDERYGTSSRRRD